MHIQELGAGDRQLGARELARDKKVRLRRTELRLPEKAYHLKDGFLPVPSISLQRREFPFLRASRVAAPFSSWSIRGVIAKLTLVSRRNYRHLQRIELSLPRGFTPELHHGGAGRSGRRANQKSKRPCGCSNSSTSAALFPRFQRKRGKASGRRSPHTGKLASPDGSYD